MNLNLESFQDRVHDFSKNENNLNFKGGKPCIIDFYVDWCAPCKTLGPIIEDISKEYDGKVDSYKIITENEKELASAFGISSVPSILFIPQVYNLIGGLNTWQSSGLPAFPNNKNNKIKCQNYIL